MLHLTWFKVNICGVLAFKCRFCLSNSSLLELSMKCFHTSDTLFSHTPIHAHTLRITTHRETDALFSVEYRHLFEVFRARSEISNTLKNLKILRSLSWIQVDSMLVNCLKLVARITQISGFFEYLIQTHHIYVNWI